MLLDKSLLAYDDMHVMCAKQLHLHVVETLQIRCAFEVGIAVTIRHHFYPHATYGWRV